MSSRSNGVMNEELIFLYSSCVIASLSCSTSTSRSLTDSTSASGSTSSDSSAVPFTRFSAARLKKSKNVSSLGRSLIRTGTPHAGPEPVEGMVVHRLALFRSIGPDNSIKRRFSASTSNVAGGYPTPRSANTSRRRVATAQSRYHLRSAGTTYHGAASVEQRDSESWYASWYRGQRSEERTSPRVDFPRFGGSSSRASS